MRKCGEWIVQIVVGIATVLWLGWGCVSELVVTNPCPSLLDDAEAAYGNGEVGRFVDLMEEADAKGCRPTSSSGEPDDDVSDDGIDPNGWNGYDIDCADVGGAVEIYGDDPNGLDADGDGVGCE